MNFWVAVSLLLTCCAALLLLWAALHDLAARTVPNALPLAILLIGACIRLIDHSMFLSLTIASVTFLVLFAIWMMGAIGGGDVKLWSASVLLVPARFQAEFSCFTGILLAGGMLAMIYLVLRWLVPRPAPSRPGGLIGRVMRAEAWRISRKAPLPYAFAIASGTLITLLPFSTSALR